MNLIRNTFNGTERMVEQSLYNFGTSTTIGFDYVVRNLLEFINVNNQKYPKVNKYHHWVRQIKNQFYRQKEDSYSLEEIKAMNALLEWD